MARIGYDPLMPDGIVIYAGRPHTKKWYTVRREGITATDLPAIVGAYDSKSKWGKTPLHVYLSKRGELPDSDNEMSPAAEAGLRMEGAIAKWWCDVHGTHVRLTGVVANAVDPRWRCSPDRVVIHCPDNEGPCGLEIKTRSAYSAGQWRDDIPDDVLAQAAWTMLVTGWNHMHVAALLGGNAPHWHRVDRDAALEAYLVTAAEDMWVRVRDGVRPEVDAGAALTRLLDALHPDRQGGRIIAQERAQTLREAHSRGSELERQGKALKEEARDGLLAILEDADEAWLEGGEKPIATYRRQARTGIQADQLKRLKTDHPDTYDLLSRGGFITTTDSRTLRWARQTEGEE